MQSLGVCKNRTSPYGNADNPVSCIAVHGQHWKYAEFRDYLSPRYCACTKATFILKGTYRGGEPKNVVIAWVQKTYLPLQDSKLPGFMHRSTWPTMEIC